MTVLGQTFCIGPTVWGHLIWQTRLKKLCLSHSEPTLPYPKPETSETSDIALATFQDSDLETQPPETWHSSWMAMVM